MGLVFVSIQPVCVFWLEYLNPFTFKVIIDIYVPIAIFLIVWGYFIDMFSFLVYLDYVSPLTFVVKLV